MCGSDIFLGLIAILFPPIAVWVKKGICSADSLINIALCCLGFLPGLFHAWYIIAVTPDPTYEELAQHDTERGNVSHHYYHHQHTQSSYGTAGGNTPNAQFPVSNEGFIQPQQALPGSSQETPPTYQQATTGDNKIQKP